jgi:hypothetical protein
LVLQDSLFETQNARLEIQMMIFLLALFTRCFSFRRLPLSPELTELAKKHWRSIIVTGISVGKASAIADVCRSDHGCGQDNHFHEMLPMFEGLRRKLGPDVPVIIYNLGLKPDVVCVIRVGKLFVCAECVRLRLVSGRSDQKLAWQYCVG